MIKSNFFGLSIFFYLFLGCSNGQEKHKTIDKVDMINESNKIKDGEWVERYDNGNISKSGFINNGAKNGIWKYFHTDGSLEKVHQYFNDTLLFVLDKNDFLFSRQFSENKEIGINIPIRWEIQKDNSQTLLIARKQCIDSTAFCPNITITKDILSDSNNIDFENYVKSNIILLSERLPYFKPIAGGNIIIDTLPAYQLTYLMQVNGVKLGGITTWIYNGLDAYVITGMAINEQDSEFLRFKVVFQGVTSSFFCSH